MNPSARRASSGTKPRHRRAKGSTGGQAIYPDFRLDLNAAMPIGLPVAVCAAANAGKYVGRVGALAVALGVGVAMATGQGLGLGFGFAEAHAEPESDGSDSSSGDTGSETSAPHRPRLASARRRAPRANLPSPHL